MTNRTELIQYIDALLDVSKFNDYAPNGLQVEGAQTIRRIVSGVTASQALIEAAIEQQADTLLVHHGYFWKGEPAPIVGMKARRVKLLLEHNINLLGYHLPLDAHPTLGNNAQLAKQLGIQNIQSMPAGGVQSLLFTGMLKEAVPAKQFAEHIEQVLNRQPLHIPPSDEASNASIHQIAWCTGGAQGFIDLAVEKGVGAYLSGEVSEKTTHSAREQGIHYFAAGHHATERYGVQALGEHIADEFGVEHLFIDVDNPV